MSDDREGFLARWSRRKAGIASPADERVDPAPPQSVPANDPHGALAPRVAAAAEPTAPLETDATPAKPLPTLADVAALTRDSDYARFMAPGVDGAVRNAAMKRLFSDPRFNVMDGLDVYIDDYNKPDPLPLEMLKKLRQSELLGLFREDTAAVQAQAGVAKASPDGVAEASPDNAGAPGPCSPTEPPAPDASSRAEDDPDLRLQPDDGDRRPGAGESARD